MNTKETLIAAKQLLIDKGISRETFEDTNGCHCMVGAVVKTVYPEVKMGTGSYTTHMSKIEVEQALDKLMVAVFEDNNLDYTELFEYNDAATVNKILTAFDVAIELCDNEA